MDKDIAYDIALDCMEVELNRLQPYMEEYIAYGTGRPPNYIRRNHDEYFEVRKAIRTMPEIKADLERVAQMEEALKKVRDYLTHDEDYLPGFLLDEIDKCLGII